MKYPVREDAKNNPTANVWHYLKQCIEQLAKVRKVDASLLEQSLRVYDVSDVLQHTR